MSTRSIVIAVLVLGLVSMLAIEGYYVYRFYADLPVSSETSALRVTAPETTAPENRGEYVAFVHRATPENIAANSTYLDSPLTNGNPDAILSVTQNWNPGGSGGTYNDHAIGVWYDPDREKWAIFNQDRADMPEGANFNVTVSGEPAE